MTWAPSKWVAMQILMRINEETWDCKLEFAYHMHVSRLGRQDLHLLELVVLGHPICISHVETWNKGNLVEVPQTHQELSRLGLSRTD